MRRSVQSFVNDLRRYPALYIMLLPVLAYYLIFQYIPIYGSLIAFQSYSPGGNLLWDAQWVGFKHFETFFSSVYFARLLRNTLLINLYLLIFAFPAPLIFALMLNELRSSRLKRAVQTVSYLPHFLSIMVICGIIVDFCQTTGFLNQIVKALGGKPVNMLAQPNLFRTIFVVSEIWQNMGWDAIIYIAALAGVDPELYEAARMDGCNRLKQALHITLPCIAPTIIILLILRIGQMMSVNFEKIILLYNPSTYETADVISSYVYRKGLINGSYDFSTAVGLFNSLVNFILLNTANRVSRAFGDTSLW